MLFEQDLPPFWLGKALLISESDKIVNAYAFYIFMRIVFFFL